MIRLALLFPLMFGLGGLAICGLPRNLHAGPTANTEEHTWNGFGIGRSLKRFEALTPETANRHSPPVLQTRAGLRLSARLGPAYGSEMQFVYDFDGALAIVSGGDTVVRGEGHDETDDADEKLRLELTPGAQFYAGMRTGSALEVFTGIRDTLRAVDRGAIGGRTFRPGLHSAYDGGDFRLYISPYFRDIYGNVGTGSDFAPSDSGPTGGRKSRDELTLPPGQFAAAILGDSQSAVGVFYELYRNSAGFAAEYAGVGLSLSRGPEDAHVSASLSFEHVANRGNPRNAPDGTPRLSGGALRSSVEGRYRGWIVLLHGFVPEPALMRPGSAVVKGDRSGYVSPSYGVEPTSPVFSEALVGIPAPVLCGRCSEGYTLSADPIRFRTQAMTGSAGLGYVWEGGRFLTTVATIVPLLPRETSGSSPFADLRPAPQRFVEYGFRLQQFLKRSGELSIGYSRLVLREDGRSQNAAELLWVAFQKRLETR